MEEGTWGINFLILYDCDYKFLKFIDQESYISLLIDINITSQDLFCFLKT